MKSESKTVPETVKTVTISIEEYEGLKAENARLNQQVQWLLEGMKLSRRKLFPAQMPSFCSVDESGTGSRPCTGRETASFCCISGLKTGNISGRETAKKPVSLRHSSTAGSWKD